MSATLPEIRNAKCAFETTMTNRLRCFPEPSDSAFQTGGNSAFWNLIPNKVRQTVKWRGSPSFFLGSSTAAATRRTNSDVPGTSDDALRRPEAAPVSEFHPRQNPAAIGRSRLSSLVPNPARQRVQPGHISPS